MPKQIIKYQCEHCHKKAYSTKRGAILHEEKCFYNPWVRSCITCENMFDGRDSARCGLLNKDVLVKGNPITLCPNWIEKEEI